MHVQVCFNEQSSRELAMDRVWYTLEDTVKHFSKGLAEKPQRLLIGIIILKAGPCR
jgi:hypothetical protein